MKLDPDITVRDGKRTDSPNKSIVQVRPRQTFGIKLNIRSVRIIRMDLLGRLSVGHFYHYIKAMGLEWKVLTYVILNVVLNINQ